MYKDALRAAWAEINITNLDYNIKQIKEKVGPNKRITGIIKADGYGHGSVKVATVLRANGIESFGVATLSEAIRLREAGFVLEEIVVLGLTPDPYVDTIVEHRLTPVVCDFKNAQAISLAAEKAGIIIKGYIAVDTGMGRIGYNPDDDGAIEDIKAIAELPNFKIQGLFSHFATADAEDKTYAAVQEQRYAVFYKKLADAGVKMPVRTLSNSAAIMEIASAHYDIVRPGIILYGCYPSDEVDKSQIDLKPVMSVKANIVHLKKVPAGTTVSYGRKWTATKDSLIATIPLGYADGFPRPYSGKGKVLVNGVVAPIAGNICMDQCMIDVTNVPYVRLGDEVTIIGKDGIHEILADDIATATGTINYEIVCAFGQRLPKVYVY
ncbi:MAG: alanine racemase [Firmicutes bacterium]|nr:alanine racemase [Bacillota bacterium]MBQ4595641.1 alanine racemase [Bacillota bacterium]